MQCILGICEAMAAKKVQRTGSACYPLSDALVSAALHSCPPPLLPLLLRECIQCPTIYNLFLDICKLSLAPWPNKIMYQCHSTLSARVESQPKSVFGALKAWNLVWYWRITDPIFKYNSIGRAGVTFKITRLMASEKKLSVADAGVWALNVVSSVGIILVNKEVMSNGGYDFRFATTLTGFHFLVTGLVGFISKASGYSPWNKNVPLWDLFWFSVIANISIVGMNFSLMLNSVGFYQISKLSMIPVVCVMEWILHNKEYSRYVKAAVFVVMIGVGICTVTDVKVNLKGFLTAAIAVLCSSLQQITIGSLQKKYNIGSFDLLSKTAPIQAASLLLLGPLVDYSLNGYNLLDYQFSAGAIFFISLSCSLAVFCNLSQYLCIGRFSAVSFQVLGHMKTVCVLCLGWLFFDSALTVKNVMGMGMAILGMVLYSWAVETAKHALLKKLPATYIKESSFTGEDAGLLKSGFEMQVPNDVEVGEETKV